MSRPSAVDEKIGALRRERQTLMSRRNGLNKKIADLARQIGELEVKRTAGGSRKLTA